MANVLLRIVGVLLILSALALALSREPDRAVQGLVARWAPPPSDFVEVKGQVVHLRDEGPRDDPLPVVLLHGTADSLHTWQGWVPALRGQRRVITLDLPGFGLTGPFGGAYAPDDYRGDTYARFVLDLLDELKLPRVALGGHSFGGEVAWRLATLAPARVERLILVDATGPDVTGGSQPLGFWIARAPGLGWFAEEVLPRALVLQGLVKAYADPQKIGAELVDRHFELALREGNRRALGQRLRQATPGQDFERVKTLKMPTLVVWGGQDRMLPPAAGQAFLKAIDGSQMVLFQDLGHLPHEEDPARTVVPVKNFLDLR